MGTRLRLTARQWGTIDAAMDIAAHAGAELGETDERYLAIRQAGWAQVPWSGAERAWPTDQQVIAVELNADQWQLVLATLETSDALYDRLGDTRSRDLGRDARRVVSNAIAETH